MDGMTASESVLDLFKGRHFDREVIVLCVRWYLSFKVGVRANHLLSTASRC